MSPTTAHLHDESDSGTATPKASQIAAAQKRALIHSESLNSAVKRPRRMPRVSLDDPTPNNIAQCRLLHSVLFPITYTPRFYREVVYGFSPVNESVSRRVWSQMAYVNDICVGVVTARLEGLIEPETHEALSNDTPASSSVDLTMARVYILTLGVLAPYRRLGVGSKLLEYVLEQCRLAATGESLGLPNVVRNVNLPPPHMSAQGYTTSIPLTPVPPVPARVQVSEVYLHVQTDNTAAVSFYERFGFVKAAEPVKDYYRAPVQPADAWLMRLSLKNE